MAFIRPIQPTHPLSTLTLPPVTFERLHRVASSIRSGTRVNPLLLTGDPSSSRAVAEAVAHEAGGELLHIDLSAMVSQYIGETEKNLDRIFATAASSQTILFFDEADALFGKRTAVQDSHDRYANLAAEGLLQRLESFPGLAIFAVSPETALPDRLPCHVLRLPSK